MVEFQFQSHFNFHTKNTNIEHNKIDQKHIMAKKCNSLLSWYSWWLNLVMWRRKRLRFLFFSSHFIFSGDFRMPFDDHKMLMCALQCRAVEHPAFGIVIGFIAYGVASVSVTATIQSTQYRTTRYMVWLLRFYSSSSSSFRSF